MTYGPSREGMTLGQWIVLLLGFVRFCLTSFFILSLRPLFGELAGPLWWGCLSCLFCLCFVVQDSGTESSKGGRL